MPFRLSRGGPNVIAEVQRWQYFLLRIGINQAGSIDGDFGLKTETATKFFQVQSGLTSNGKVNDQTLQKAQEFGYTILADNYYKERAGTSFPAEPNDIESPSNASRNAAFTWFRFSQRPRAQRPDAEAIVIKGSCDGTLSDWTASKIVEVPMPQLRFARGFNGKVRCHKLAAPIFIKLLEAWERADLLHLIMSYDGCFVPRYKRKQAPPGAGGHGEKQSVDVSALSNHSFGSAFHINFSDNMLDQVPALCGGRGSTRELVAAANALKVFWGAILAHKTACISRLADCRNNEAACFR